MPADLASGGVWACGLGVVAAMATTRTTSSLAAKRQQATRAPVALDTLYQTEVAACKGVADRGTSGGPDGALVGCSAGLRAWMVDAAFVAVDAMGQGASLGGQGKKSSRVQSVPT